MFEAEAPDGVFKDKSVLSHHYIPKDMPFREPEIKQITHVLSSLINNVKPNNIFLYGKTGTGKTSVVKSIARELESLLADPARNKMNVRAVTSYMNCRLGCNSKYQILLKILEEPLMNGKDMLSRPLDGVRNGNLAGRSPTELVFKLRKMVEANAIHLIVVLDELDMVRDINEILYTLTRLNDEIAEVNLSGSIIRGSISVIGISNKHSFKNSLDTRTKSSLCGEEIVFKPYNAKQLNKILADRVEMGFRKRGISPSNIALIAAHAAQTNGDARYGLRLLEKAGDTAQSHNRKRVNKEDITEARAKVEADIIHELITTLPEHQQIVLYSIADLMTRGSNYRRLSDAPADVLFSGEVYENYERICKHLNRSPKTMRWFSEYLKEMEMLGLVTLSISGSGIRGTTTLIRLGSNPQELKKIVSASLGIGSSE